MRILRDEQLALLRECELYEAIKAGDVDCERCTGNCRAIAEAQARETLKEVAAKIEPIFATEMPFSELTGYLAEFATAWEKGEWLE